MKDNIFSKSNLMRAVCLPARLRRRLAVAAGIAVIFGLVGCSSDSDTGVVNGPVAVSTYTATFSKFENGAVRQCSQGPLTIYDDNTVTAVTIGAELAGNFSGTLNGTQEVGDITMTATINGQTYTATAITVVTGGQRTIAAGQVDNSNCSWLAICNTGCI